MVRSVGRERTTQHNRRDGGSRNLVELVRRYSNHADLQERLMETLHKVTQRDVQDQEASEGDIPNGRSPRVWRVRDRLSEHDIRQLIDRYHAGATTRELAEIFKIGKTTVRLLLRQHGVRRRDQSLVLQPDFVTLRRSGLDVERPPFDDHGL